jgi:hypothetical protein
MRSKSTVFILVAAASMFAALYAQQPKKAAAIPDADWPEYNRDHRSSRYSPLTQINASNVAQLKEAWSYRPPAPAPPPDGAKAKAKGKGGAAADTTPEHAKACEDLWDRSGGFFSAGPFTPFLLQREGVPPRSTIIFPGAGGMATDQQRGIVFAYSQDQAQVGWTEKKKPGVTYAFDEAKSNFPTLAQASMVRVRSIPSARPQAGTWANSHVRNRRGAG